MKKYTLYKEEFFNYKQLNESVVKGYNMLFNKVSKLENELDKDLKDFNYEELLEVLQLFKSKSYNSMFTKWSLLKLYLESYGNEDVKMITNSEIEKNIQTVENSNRFIKREEFYSEINKLRNPSDKAILLLLFEGVMGTGYKELLNLKVEQIDTVKGEVKLDGRVIELDEVGKDILIATINQKEYLLDDSSFNLNKKYYFKLNSKSPYLIKSKPTVNTKDGMSPLGVEGVKSKISRLFASMNLEFVTGQSLVYSGIIEKLLKYENEHNKELSISEIKKFVTSLGIKKIQPQILKEAKNVYAKKYNLTK